MDSTPRPQTKPVVLVVEDEAAIRHLVDIVLSRSGYHVRTAESAAAADAVLLDFPESPAFALLDMILPGGTNGVVYGERLAVRFPAIRLIFMTGWLDRPETGQAEQRGRLLPKPFTTAALLAALRH